MGKLISVDLPKDLPENWNDSNYVSPTGVEVGLTERHGYNYLMRQVNASQQGVLDIESILCAGNTNLLDNSYFFNLVNRDKGFVVLPDTTYYTDKELTSDEGVLLEVLDANVINDDIGCVDFEGEMYYVSASDMIPGFITKSNGSFAFSRWWAKNCNMYCTSKYSNLFISSNGTDKGVMRQAVHNSHELAGRYVVFSVLVTSLTGSAKLSLYKSYTASEYNDAIIKSKDLVLGLNQIVVEVPSDIGKSAYRYLVCAIEIEQGCKLNVSAVKLQLGTTSNLAYYVEEDDEWKLIDIPNTVVETLRCNGAPTSIGGIGRLLAPEDIGLHTANTMATAQIVTEEA